MREINNNQLYAVLTAEVCATVIVLMWLLTSCLKVELVEHTKREYLADTNAVRRPLLELQRP